MRGRGRPLFGGEQISLTTASKRRSWRITRIGRKDGYETRRHDQTNSNLNHTTLHDITERSRAKQQGKGKETNNRNGTREGGGRLIDITHASERCSRSVGWAGHFDLVVFSLRFSVKKSRLLEVFRFDLLERINGWVVYL